MGREGQGGLWKGLQAGWGLGRGEPRRDGGRREGRGQLSGPAGPSAYGAVVLGCFILKNFQRARPSGPPQRGAEQMVCKQNSFGSGGEGDLSKVAGAQPRHGEQGSGSSIALGSAGVCLWAGRLCGSWGCWCPHKPPVRALSPNPALESWLGAAHPLCLASLSSHTNAPGCGIALQRSALSSLGNG